MTLAMLIAVSVEGGEHSGNVALETIGYGIVALVVFGAMALVTLSYRHVANRHDHKADAYARSQAARAQQTGHGH